MAAEAGRATAITWSKRRRNCSSSKPLLVSFTTDDFDGKLRTIDEVRSSIGEALEEAKHQVTMRGEEEPAPAWGSDRWLGRRKRRSFRVTNPIWGWNEWNASKDPLDKTSVLSRDPKAQRTIHPLFA